MTDQEDAAGRIDRRDAGRRRASPVQPADEPAWQRLLYGVIHKLLALGFVSIVLLFLAGGLMLIGFSALELWSAVQPAEDRSVSDRFLAVLECIALLTIAVAALELAQTILEEEVQRSLSLSAPTRVRRFLSRFLVVIVVSLSIECLVAVFRSAHDAPEQLPYAAAIGASAALLLVGWALFVRLNVGAERLEPQAIAEAQVEDDEVESHKEQSSR